MLIKAARHDNFSLKWYYHAWKMHEEEEKTSNLRSYSRKNNDSQTAEEVRITNHIFCNKLPLHTEQVLLMSCSMHPLDRSLL